MHNPHWMRPEARTKPDTGPIAPNQMRRGPEDYGDRKDCPLHREFEAGTNDHPVNQLHTYKHSNVDLSDASLANLDWLRYLGNNDNDNTQQLHYDFK